LQDGRNGSDGTAAIPLIEKHFQDLNHHAAIFLAEVDPGKLAFGVVDEAHTHYPPEPDSAKKDGRPGVSSQSAASLATRKPLQELPGQRFQALTLGRFPHIL
jgi:hypothetical protein